MQKHNLLTTLTQQMKGIKKMEIQKISGSRQLFIDNHIIDKISNLKRTLHQPIKYVGNPIIMPFSPCEGQSINIFGTVMYDEDIYKMWYQGYGGSTYSAHYATSKDGIYWEKPK